MSKTRNPNKMRWTYRQQSLGAWVILGICSAALVGCSSTPATHSGDPLFGEYYPKGPNGQPLPPPNPAQKTTSIGVPPYPAANSASSTAAIATNTSLPGGRPLAINEKNGLNGSLTNTSAPAGVGIGTPIVQPIPRDTTGPVATANPAGTSTPAIATNLGNAATPVGTIIPTGSWTAPAQSPATTSPAAAPAPASPSPAPGPAQVPVAATADALQAALEGKGAVGLKQENVPEGVRVSCYMPRPSSPANIRYLETVAGDYATALQAILQQADQ
jgi:hypothetical protein